MSKVLTIQRSQWWRGKGSFGSFLLNNDGMMCCLGFDALALGLSKTQIILATSPYMAAQDPAVSDEYRAARLGPGGDNNKAVCDAMHCNDDTYLSEVEREKHVTRYLKQLGWDDVVFVD